MTGDGENSHPIPDDFGGCMALCIGFTTSNIQLGGPEGIRLISGPMDEIIHRLMGKS